MSANLPLLGAITSIQAVDIIPSNGFDWAKLAVQLILGIVGFIQHRKSIKENKKNNQ